MGMTLRVENFKEILKRPKLIGAGIAMQFILMPAIAYAVALLLGLPTELLAGMVLVGTAPGGTASNVICYLARGDVALSITLTAASTFLSVLLTPLLTWLYIGQRVAPVSIGLIVNRYAGSRLHPLKRMFPYLSMVAIVLIIGIVVALNQAQISMLALPVVTAVFWHNILGLAGGYYAAKWLGFDERRRRTLAIEVGMQNSGLAVALAQSYFSSLAALPGALFSIWHNITGSILAGYWTHKSKRKERLDAGGSGFTDLG
jgi:BASS family bile acid:Na+ symporter